LSIIKSFRSTISVFYCLYLLKRFASDPLLACLLTIVFVSNKDCSVGLHIVPVCEMKQRGETETG